MIRLVYVSSLAAAVSDETVEEIVGAAARRNASLSVTGILAMEDRKICQVLEGEEEVVQRLFRTISADRRHEGLVEIERRPIEKRSFPNWSMTRRPMIDVVMMALS